MVGFAHSLSIWVCQLSGSPESENRSGCAHVEGNGIRMVHEARGVDPKGCSFGVWWGHVSKKLGRPHVYPLNTKECMTVTKYTSENVSSIEYDVVAAPTP